MRKIIHKFLGREFNATSSTFVQCEATPGETSSGKDEDLNFTFGNNRNAIASLQGRLGDE